MRAAPAVSVVLAPNRPWLIAVAAFGAWAGAAGAGTLSSHLPWAAHWAWPMGLVAALGTAAWAGAPWRRHDARQLRWDGERWWLASPPALEVQGELTVAMDFGGWMLLRFHPPGAGLRRAAWLPLDAHGSDAHAVRAAIYSRPLSPDHPPRRGDPA